MLIILSAVFIITLVVATIMFYKTSFDTWWLQTISEIVLIFICLPSIILCSITCINGKYIDEKIQLYEEENSNIELSISEIVKNYQTYEKEIFTEVSPESSVALVSLYPELNSDTLVQKQVSIYVKNNDKIKELKEEEISLKSYKWWLYFGS